MPFRRLFSSGCCWLPRAEKAQGISCRQATPKHPKIPLFNGVSACVGTEYVYLIVRARRGTKQRVLAWLYRHKKGALLPPLSYQPNRCTRLSNQNPNTYAQNPTKIQVKAVSNPSKIQVNVHFVFPLHNHTNKRNKL